MTTILQRLLQALSELSQTASYDYYDGNHVWCRFCQATRPSPDRDADLTWHDDMCIYRVAHESFGLITSMTE